MIKVDIHDLFNIVNKGNVFCCEEFDGWNTITELEVINTNNNPKVITGKYRVIDRDRFRSSFIEANSIGFILEPYFDSSIIYNTFKESKTIESDIKRKVKQFENKCKKDASEILTKRDELIKQCLNLVDEVGIFDDNYNGTFIKRFKSIDDIEFNKDCITFYWKVEICQLGVTPGCELTIYYKALNQTVEFLKDNINSYIVPGYIELEEVDY